MPNRDSALLTLSAAGRLYRTLRGSHGLAGRSRDGRREDLYSRAHAHACCRGHHGARCDGNSGVTEEHVNFGGHPLASVSPLDSRSCLMLSAASLPLESCRIRPPSNPVAIGEYSLYKGYCPCCISLAHVNLLMQAARLSLSDYCGFVHVFQGLDAPHPCLSVDARAVLKLQLSTIG